MDCFASGSWLVAIDSEPFCSFFEKNFSLIFWFMLFQYVLCPPLRITKAHCGSPSLALFTNL